MIGSKLLLPGAKCLVINADLAYALGKSAAILLQQIHYWISNEKIKGKVHQEKKWISNSYTQWAEDLSVISPSTVKRSIQKLKSFGAIQVENFSKQKGDRTNWITINYDKLSEFSNVPNLNANSQEKCEKSTDHQVKMTQSSGQNDPLYIDKITNKNINTKSEQEPVIKFLQVDPESQYQVEQIKNINFTNDLNNTRNSSNPDQSSNKTTITQEMLSFWNKTFPKSQAQMSKELAPLLVSAFKTKFNSDMIQWKHYCLIIESSKYLTGESFNLSIYWSLKFNTIDRIRAGEFGVKDVLPPISEDIQIAQENAEIEVSNETEICKNVRRCLLKKYGVLTYKSWFKLLELREEAEEVRFKARSKFEEDWILNNYPELVL